MKLVEDSTNQDILLKKRCMFCDGIAELHERPSLYDGVIEVSVRCSKCEIEFLARFREKVWERIMKVYWLAQLGR